MKNLLTLLYVLSASITLLAQTSSNNLYFLEVVLKDSISPSFLPHVTNPHLSNSTALNSILNQYQVTKYSRVYKNSNNPALKNIYQIKANGNIDSLKSRLIQTGLFNSVIKRERVSLASCSNPTSINDTWIAQGWAGRDALDMVEAPCAWSITHGSPNISVAIVDTHIDAFNPDLANKITAIIGNNTPYNDPSFNPANPNSHGTRSAGIVCAETNNNEGVASIGYDTKVAFYCEDGSTLPTNIYQAYQDGRKVISVSWTGSVNATAAQEITDGGTVLVVAAGNQPTAQCHWDIANIPGVILVSGVGNDNRYSSTVGDPPTVNLARNQYIDLCAPAVNVTTTEMAPTNYTGGWKTSIAAPQVAATVALMISVNSCLTPAEIEEVLKSTTDPIADAASYPGQLGTGRLNAYKAVLKASQWGNSSLEVTNGQNITLNSKMMYDNIYVRTGGTLTISNTTIYMDNFGKIVVEKGAKLNIINNSFIRSHPITPYLTCFQDYYRWQGIQVEGQPSYDQVPNSNQGVVYINNSTIQDAIDAVSTISTDANGNIVWSKTGGGIITAINSTFTNNQRHVQLMSYHRTNDLNNLCSFTACNFETDQTRFTGSSARQRMFTNWDTKGVAVYGCNFKNTNAGLNANHTNTSGQYDADRGTGIYTVDASMKIQDRQVLQNGNLFSIPSLFYDLQIGVDDYHYLTSPLNGHIIKKNTFERNIYGIQQTNASSSHIYRNNFKLEYTSGYPTYTKSGFWGINAGGFQISENLFTNNTGTNFNEIGSTFKNSDANSGGLYILNTHTSTNVGGQTELRNQNLDYKCNGHNIERNVGILFNPKNPSTAPKDPVTFLPYFGSCATNRIDKDNTFNSNSTDIYNNTSSTKEYVIDPNRPNRPRAAFSVAININPCGNGPANCSVIEPPEPNGWEPVDGKKPAYLAKKADVSNDKQPILDGSAQSLLNLIAQGASVSANDLFDALYAKSPYLSDAVIISMLQTSQHLSEQQTLDILVSNSRLTSSIIGALSYRNFSQSALNTINSAQSTQSAREILEMEIEQGERELNQLKIDLLNYYFAGYLSDTLNNYGDSVIVMLENEEDEFSIKQLASIYLSRGETESATQKLDLLDDSNAENVQFINLMNLLIALKDDDKNVFQITSEQEETIRSIAASSTNAAYHAKAILGLVFGEYADERPVLFDQGLGKKGNETTGISEQVTSGSNLLNIYPNPASNTVIFDYMVIKHSSTSKITISNIAGATIHTIPLKQMSGQYEMNVHGLSPGIYFIELRNNDALISVKKLVVNN